MESVTIFLSSLITGLRSTLHAASAAEVKSAWPFARSSPRELLPDRFSVAPRSSLFARPSAVEPLNYVVIQKVSLSSLPLSLLLCPLLASGSVSVGRSADAAAAVTHMYTYAHAEGEGGGTVDIGC